MNNESEKQVVHLSQVGLQFWFNVMDSVFCAYLSWIPLD